mmetsp:Transcript_18457/g.26948  ORF Transcript_18457/g.26948 Transcript_18457/m.26948 type:complete len:218 (-) Transcript_18457:471-1124(-)
MSLSSVRCPSGRSSISFALTDSSLRIPDSMTFSGVTTSDRGGPTGCCPTAAGGLVVASPAIAPCKSERVNPPEFAPDDLGAGAPGVAAAVIGAGVTAGADDEVVLLEGCGMPRFSRILLRASTCGAELWLSSDSVPLVFKPCIIDMSAALSSAPPSPVPAAAGVADALALLLLFEDLVPPVLFFFLSAPAAVSPLAAAEASSGSAIKVLILIQRSSS